MSLYQLPAALKFTVQTTVGSNAAIVTAGPRPIVSGEMIWSDAFPLGTTVISTSGNTFPQTVNMVTYTGAAGPVQNATVTHSSGSPGQMWIMPYGLKRDVVSNSNNNNFYGFPVGLGMACTSGGYINCTGSYDTGNSYRFDLIGRYTAGNNTSASSSINEHAATNYWMDFLNGATLGEVDLNFNSNSWEGGSAAYAIMGNCANQNWSVLFGGYIVGGGAGGCADPTKIFPPTTGSPWFAIGNQTQGIVPAGTPSMFSGSFAGPWEFLKNGFGADPCVGMHVVVYIFAVSHNGCQNFGTVGVQWYGGHNAWTWSGAAGTDAMFNMFGEDYGGYLPGGINGGITPQVLLLGNPSEDYTGQERALDAGLAASTNFGCTFAGRHSPSIKRISSRRLFSVDRTPRSGRRLSLPAVAVGTTTSVTR